MLGSLQRSLAGLCFAAKGNIDAVGVRAVLAQRADEVCRQLAAHIGASQAEVRKITLREV